MFRATWKSLLGHKLRMAMSTFAIILGISFVSGSLMFTDLLGQTVDGMLKGTLSDINVGRKSSDYNNNQSSPDSLVTPELLNKIRDVDGVDAAHGINVGHSLIPLNNKDQVLGLAQAPTVTSNFFEAPAAGGLDGLVIKTGHAPGDDEILLDPTALQNSGFSEGDQLPVIDSTTNTRMSFKIVGTATWGSGGTFGATYLFVSDETARNLFSAGSDAFQSAWVVTAPGADVSKVTEEVNKLLPSSLIAQTADEAAAETQKTLDEALSFMNNFLLIFAGISLVVAIFLIVNTFTIIVAQRGRELALLRALGSSRNQVRTSVLAEAAIVGLIGATIGIGLGWLLALAINAVMGSIGMSLGDASPTITPAAVIVSYVVGLVVTMVAAYVPAHRAASVPPVAAMTGDFMTGEKGLGARSLFAAGLVILGAGGIVIGLFDWFTDPLIWVGVGSMLVLVGVALGSPMLGRPVTWLLGRLYQLMFGTVGRLAELNAARNPRRTAATASALMIGLALVATMSILGQTAKSSMSELTKSALRGDLMVQSMRVPIAPSVGDKLEGLDGVKEVQRVRESTGIYDGEPVYMIGTPANGFSKVYEQNMVEGSLTDDPYTIVIEEGWANDHSLSVGSKLPMNINGKDTNLLVTGIFTVPDGITLTTHTNLSTLEALGVQPLDSTYSIYVEDGHSVSDVKNRVEDALTDLPLISVNDAQSMANEMSAQIDSMLAIIYGLLALSIVIAVLGIINTLALSVIERTREIGLLRAIGLTRGQLRRMISLESVVVSVLGAALGVGMGLVFGVALQRPLADQGLKTLSIPWDLLGIFLVVSVLIGILAAVWPARRAAKLDVLQAIATD